MIGFFHEDEQYGCFSNWYNAEFDYAGIHFANSEQFMMYHKVMMFGREDLGRQILMAADPAECKKIAKQHFPEFNSDVWDRSARTIVKRGVRAKFLQNPDLRKELLETDHELLAECSPYDKRWGIGIDIADPNREDIHKWPYEAQNQLGIILMEVRQELSQLSEIIPVDKSWYRDALHAEPIPEWNMTAGELKRIPQYYSTVHAYANALSTYSARDSFYYDYTLAQWEQKLEAGENGIIPRAGFYELKQDVFDIPYFMRAFDCDKYVRMDKYCQKYLPFLEMVNGDAELKGVCQGGAGGFAPVPDEVMKKHKGFFDFLYKHFYSDAYRENIISQDYLNVTDRMKRDGTFPENYSKEKLSGLSEEQILACLSLCFRIDHFDCGTSNNEV